VISRQIESPVNDGSIEGPSSLDTGVEATGGANETANESQDSTANTVNRVEERAREQRAASRIEMNGDSD
jgi:hypothetical protein